jgi:hypothetical protein
MSAEDGTLALWQGHSPLDVQVEPDQPHPAVEHVAEPPEFTGAQ